MSWSSKLLEQHRQRAELAAIKKQYQPKPKRVRGVVTEVCDVCGLASDVGSHIGCKPLAEPK